MTESYFHISGMAYYLPPERISADVLMRRSRVRLERLKKAFQFTKAFREFEGFGIESVPVAGDRTAVEMAVKAVDEALTLAGTDPGELDLIIDFSTVPAPEGSVGLAVQQIFRARKALCLHTGNSGCAAFHIALWMCRAMFKAHPHIRSALLVSSDKTPPESRMCFPLSILGDGASAVVVSRAGLYAVSGIACRSIGELRDAIGLPTLADEPIPVDINTFENRLLPVYFKAMQDVVDDALADAGHSHGHVSLLIYPNMSEMDRSGFIRALRFPPEKLFNGDWRNLGHIFASDMVINLCRSQDAMDIQPGGTILLAGSGAGFYWGATVLKAI